MRALVSGATGNVGWTCVHLLTMQNWEVVGVSRGGSDLASFHRVDLSDQYKVVDFTKTLPGFDLVIMTHGTQQAVELGSYCDYYDKVRANNLDSAVYLTDALIHWDKLNPGALIVYCSSIHATQPRAGRGPYAVAKAGLEALARVVAIEQAEAGIRAVALRLGQMDKMMKNIAFSPEQMKAITDKLLTEPVSCEDVARFILALYDQKSLTGETIEISSGHSLNIWAGL